MFQERGDIFVSKTCQLTPKPSGLINNIISKRKNLFFYICPLKVFLPKTLLKACKGSEFHSLYVLTM